MQMQVHAKSIKPRYIMCCDVDGRCSNREISYSQYKTWSMPIAHNGVGTDINIQQQNIMGWREVVLFNRANGSLPPATECPSLPARTNSLFSRYCLWLPTLLFPPKYQLRQRYQVWLELEINCHKQSIYHQPITNKWNIWRKHTNRWS